MDKIQQLKAERLAKKYDVNTLAIATQFAAGDEIEKSDILFSEIEYVDNDSFETIRSELAIMIHRNRPKN